MDPDTLNSLVASVGLGGARLVLEIYAGDTLTQVQRARDHLNKGHLEGARRAARTLRLLSESRGMWPVVEDCVAVEAAANAYDVDRRLRRLERTAYTARHAILSELVTMPPPKAA